MSNVKKAAIEYAIERVPDSVKFKEQVIVGNYLREEIHDSFIRGFEFANEWHSMPDLPKKSSLIVLEYCGCSDSKNFTIYDYDTDFFCGKFHVNGIPTRWRYFL